MNFGHEKARTILLGFIEDNPEYSILGDPDLDGIFATALVARALGAEISRINYPKPSEIDSVKAVKSILIELPLTKGITYVGRNVLIDHHNSNPLITLYNGPEKVEEVVFSYEVRSVSRLITNIFSKTLSIDENGIRLLEAVDEIDSGSMTMELSDKMNKAFLLNSMKQDVRNELTSAVYRMNWNDIIEWVKKESNRWGIVEGKMEKLRKNVGREGKLTYFKYNVADQLEAAARRMLMMELEEKGGIVLCMGLRKNKPVSATIATRSNFNLNRVYEELRKNRGVRAGGRDRIGGIQFKLDFSPDEALNIVQRAVECVLNA